MNGLHLQYSNFAGKQNRAPTSLVAEMENNVDN